eukprot:CAMPEP_0174713290 /NCGR_PEP_ID=MMETSP1094-20130205/14010_1 /TAXON_ID=156173 /ORGANISM="Chrysochromulina brevifilum, Strain UTEX LB 985" /LENGTH=147 /DNA_ID=CAMNT_0015912459 /DNA_START=433 /DNA_END=876 /DNA_ORIENTATION=-
MGWVADTACARRLTPADGAATAAPVAVRRRVRPTAAAIAATAAAAAATSVSALARWERVASSSDVRALLGGFRLVPSLVMLPLLRADELRTLRPLSTPLLLSLCRDGESDARCPTAVGASASDAGTGAPSAACTEAGIGGESGTKTE